MTMAKEKTPLSLRLKAHQLGQLLGAGYQQLIHSIQQLTNAQHETALVEDKHSETLAGLFLLLRQYPPEMRLQNTLALIVANCSPAYRFFGEAESLHALQAAQAEIEAGIDETKLSHWLMRQTALEYLENLHASYAQALADFNRFLDEPALQVGICIILITQLQDQQGHLLTKSKTY